MPLGKHKAKPAFTLLAAAALVACQTPRQADETAPISSALKGPIPVILICELPSGEPADETYVQHKVDRFARDLVRLASLKSVPLTLAVSGEKAQAMGDILVAVAGPNHEITVLLDPGRQNKLSFTELRADAQRSFLMREIAAVTIGCGVAHQTAFIPSGEINSQVYDLLSDLKFTTAIVHRSEDVLEAGRLQGPKDLGPLLIPLLEAPSSLSVETVRSALADYRSRVRNRDLAVFTLVIRPHQWSDPDTQDEKRLEQFENLLEFLAGSSLVQPMTAEQYHDLVAGPGRPLDNATPTPTDTPLATPTATSTPTPVAHKILEVPGREPPMVSEPESEPPETTKVTATARAASSQHPGTAVPGRPGTRLPGAATDPSPAASHEREAGRGDARPTSDIGGEKIRDGGEERAEETLTPTPTPTPTPPLSRDSVLRVEAGSGPAGSPATIRFDVSNPSAEIRGMNLTVRVSPAVLHSPEFLATHRTSGFLLDGSSKGQGLDEVILIGIGENIETGSGPVLEAIYQVAQNAPPGPVSISIVKIDAADEHTRRLPVQVVNGTFTVRTGPPDTLTPTIAPAKTATPTPTPTRKKPTPTPTDKDRPTPPPTDRPTLPPTPEPESPTPTPTFTPTELPADTVISILGAVGAPGSNGNPVSVILDNPSIAVRGIEMNIQDVPDKLTAMEVRPTDRTAEGFLIRHNDKGPEGITVICVGLGAEIAPGSGPVFVVYYDVSAQVGGTTEVSLNLTDVNVGSPAGKALPIETVDGIFLIQ